MSVLTIDTKPSLASGECATGLPKFVRSQTTAFDNALEGADGDWLAAVHGNDGLPPTGMAPFLVAAVLAHAREAMHPNKRLPAAPRVGCSLLTLMRHGPLRVAQERPRVLRYCCQAGRRLATKLRSLGWRLRVRSANGAV